MESTFNKDEVENFLSLTNNNFAATRWHIDIKSETPTWLETSNWFQYYFTDPNAGQYMFRLCEAHCIQHIAEL